MFSLRDFWRRHKRKVYVASGLLGSSYFLYKLYAAHRRRISELESEYEGQREMDELIKTQLQTHFENIQRISDSTTLPYAMHYLRCRVLEELDISHLTERLMQVKGQPSTAKKEKFELWERLKILSFTRTALSLWAMTMLSLYIRVQVNILGRHLYIDAARGLGSSQALDEADPFDRHGQQEFLATADYLSNYGMSSLIINMQKAAAEVLKESQLTDLFSIDRLRETIKQILESFMGMVGSSDHWVAYLVPGNALEYKQLVAASHNFSVSSVLPDISKLDQLMIETRAVLLSDDFRSIAEISMKKVADAMVEEIEMQSAGGNSPSFGTPLAKLLPRVAQLGPQLLEEPNQNKYIQIIRSLQEVELFFTLLYANMPPPS